MDSPKPTPNPPQPPGHLAGGNGATNSAQLLAKARADSATLLQELASRLEGLSQAALTGEALPVERKADPAPTDGENPLDLSNLCFLGSNVESGSATAVVIHSAGCCWRSCYRAT